LRALSIAVKDTRHVYRNVAGLAMMLLAPLLLTFALSAAFGSGNNFSVGAVRTVVANQDVSAGAGAGTPAAGATLVSTLTSPGMTGLLKVTQVDSAAAARSAVDNGDADVAVIIPAGLTNALTSAAPAGAGAPAGGGAGQIQIYRDPALTVAPAIVLAVVQSVVGSLNGARAAAGTSAQLAASLGVTDSAELSALATQTAQAFAGLAQTSGPVTLEQRAPAVPGAGQPKSPNVASQVLLGMMLFFMLFGAATPARSILDEHRQGTLSRLFTTPTPRSAILVGKYVAVFLVVLIQAVVLLVAGRFLMGAHWGSLGPVIILTLVSALVAASLGLLTVSYAKTPAQAGAGSAAIFVFLGLISGNFVGSANIGGTFAIVRRISPIGWLMEGWDNLLFGGSWSSIALPVGAALAFALAFFGIATFFFRRRYT
jgi:ABC-type multidrug transport system permease subunit